MAACSWGWHRISNMARYPSNRNQNHIQYIPIYYSEKQWEAVASARPYADLQLIPNHASPQHFLAGQMPFLPPNKHHQSTDLVILACAVIFRDCRDLVSYRHRECAYSVAGLFLSAGSEQFYDFSDFLAVSQTFLFHFDPIYVIIMYVAIQPAYYFYCFQFTI